MDERDRLGNIAIASAQYPPQSNFIEFAEGPFSGAAKGAAGMGLGAAAYTGLVAATAAFSGPAVFAAVVGTTLATASGGAVGFVAGATEPFTPERKQEMEEAFREALRSLNAQQILAENLTTKTAEYTRASLGTHKINGPTSPAEALNYKQFSDTGIDTVLEVAISDIDFDACGSGLLRPHCPDGSDDLLINFVLIGKVRLVRTSNGDELYTKSFSYSSPPRSLAEWAGNNVGALTNDLNNGFRDLADRIASELFLVTPLEIPVPGYWTLPGDPLYLVCWLYPIDPPVKFKATAEFLADLYKHRGMEAPFAGYPVSLMKYNQLDSLDPTLRWSAFPTEFEKDRLEPDILSGIHDVTYDLRIWEAERNTRGELVYERSGLPEPSHKLHQSLEQNRFYFWSFRARFMYDGHHMSTRWASLRPTQEYESMQIDYCNKEGISNFSYYRFMTSSEETNTGQDISTPADTIAKPGAQ